MMSDTRLAMREFRFLDEKRKLTALSSSEEQRWRELKQALGTPEPNVPARSQGPSTSPDQRPTQSAEGNGYPMPGAPVPAHYAPHTTPGYGQMPAGPQGYPPPGSPEALPPAELLGLSESPAPPQPTVADTQPAAANVGHSATAPREAASDEVVELDSSEVTLLDAEAEPATAGAPQAIARAPEPKRQSPAPVPSFRAQAPAAPAKDNLPQPARPAPPQPTAAEPPQDEGTMIDLSAAEAIDTGEFGIPESPSNKPAPVRSAAPAAKVEVPSQSAASVFTQPPVSLEARQPAAGPSVVEGEHRVIIHTHEGQVKRGTIRNLDVRAKAIALEQSGQSEQVPTDQIKAIFFMKGPGVSDAPASGQKIRVTLADGRQVLGFSTDFQSEAPGFFLVPVDVRTNTNRIYLFRSALEAINLD